MNQKTAAEISAALKSQQGEIADTLTEYSIPSHIAGDVAAGKTLKMKTNWDLVHKEAVEASYIYGSNLKKKGIIKIAKTKMKNGREVFAGYKDYDFLKSGTKEEKDKIHKIIQKGLKDGRPLGYKEWKRGAGYPKGSVASELHEHFNGRKSHAALVARTENARLQGKGMKTRFRSSGINFSRWRSVGDDDVRPEHKAREEAGIYPINEIPDLGEPNCRCTQVPVTDREALSKGKTIPKEPQTISPAGKPITVPKKEVREGLLARTDGKVRYNGPEARAQILKIEEDFEKGTQKLRDALRVHATERDRLNIQRKELMDALKLLAKDDPDLDADLWALQGYIQRGGKYVKEAKYIHIEDTRLRQALTDISNQMVDVTLEIKRLKEPLRQKIFEEILFHADGSAGTRFKINIGTLKKGKLKDNIDEGMDFLNKVVRMGITDRPKTPDLRVFKATERGLSSTVGYFSDEKNILGLRAGRSPSDITTIVHEMGHMLEYRIYGTETSARFLDSVCDPIVRKLGSIDKEYSYTLADITMLGKKSKISSSYTTRIYLPHGSHPRDYKGILGSDISYVDMGVDATEVVSVGLERLYQDPLAFVEEPEYFDLIWSLIKGL